MILNLIKSRKLDGSIDFNGLDISIETGRSRHREWHNPQDGSSGMSRMMLPYGYIKGTEGTDGDHVDVFVGPDREANLVYVIHTVKAPDFMEYDEDKCILGAGSPEEAFKVFHASYSEPRFFGSMSIWPFDEFKEAVFWLKGRKLENDRKYIPPAPESANGIPDRHMAAPHVESHRFITIDELKGYARQEPITKATPFVQNVREAWAAVTKSSPFSGMLLRKGQLTLFEPHHKEYDRTNLSGTVSHIKAKGWDRPPEPPKGPQLKAGVEHGDFIHNGAELFKHITGFDNAAYEAEHDRLKGLHKEAEATREKVKRQLLDQKIPYAELEKHQAYNDAHGHFWATKLVVMEHAKTPDQMLKKLIDHLSLHTPKERAQKRAKALAGHLPAAQTRAFGDIYQLAGLNSAHSLTHVMAMDRGYRATAGDNNIKLSPTDDKQIVWHEFGHHVESSWTAVNRAAARWRMERADRSDKRGNGQTKPLNEICKNSRYRSEEYALPDKFADPYIGKVYKNGHTEVVSMGFGYLSKTSAFRQVLKKDPEHLHLIIGMLHYVQKETGLYKSQRPFRGPMLLLRKSQLDLFGRYGANGGMHHVSYTRHNKNGTVSLIKQKGVQPIDDRQMGLDFTAEPEPPPKPKFSAGVEYHDFIANGKDLFKDLVGFDIDEHMANRERLRIDANEKQKVLSKLETKFNKTERSLSELRRDKAFAASIKKYDKLRDETQKAWAALGESHYAVPTGHAYDKIMAHFTPKEEREADILKAESVARDLNHTQQRNIKAFYVMIGAHNVKSLNIAVTGAGDLRANADLLDGKINLSPYDGKTTVWHECAHHLEWSNKEIAQAVAAWRNDKAEKTSGKYKMPKQFQLNQICETSRYKADEFAYKDHYTDAYVGKVYWGYQQPVTEVLSMGFSYLSDKSKFETAMKTDPSHMLMMVGILHHLKNKPVPPPPKPKPKARRGTARWMREQLEKGDRP